MSHNIGSPLMNILFEQGSGKIIISILVSSDIFIFYLHIFKIIFIIIFNLIFVELGMLLISSTLTLVNCNMNTLN